METILGSFVAAILLLFANVRLWHLVADDALTAPIRDRLPPKVRSWTECPRCSGFWTSLAVTTTWVLIVIDAPAASLGTWVAIVIIAFALNYIHFKGREIIADATALAEKAIFDAHTARQRAIDTPRERL